MDGGEGRGLRAKGEVCRDMREEVIVRVRGAHLYLYLNYHMLIYNYHHSEVHIWFL